MTLLEVLIEYEARLRALDAPVLDHLLPGRSPDEVVPALTEAVGVAPPELVDWFAWHDGVALDRERGTFGNVLGAWEPYGLADAIEVREWKEGYAPFPPNVLPLMANGDKQRVLAECHVSGEASLLHEDWGYSYPAEVRPLSPSLQDFVSAWMELIDVHGMYWNHERGTWDVPDPDSIPPELYRRITV